MNDKLGTVYVHVFGALQGLRISLAAAEVKIYETKGKGSPKVVKEAVTGPEGRCSFVLSEGHYKVRATFRDADATGEFHLCEGASDEEDVTINLAELNFKLYVSSKDSEADRVLFTGFDLKYKKPTYLTFTWPKPLEPITMAAAATGAVVRLLRTGSALFLLTPTSEIVNIAFGASGRDDVAPEPSVTEGGTEVPVPPPDVSAVEGDLSVSLKRTASRETGDLALWAVIRRATDALGFDRYMDFMNWIFCGEDNQVDASSTQRDRLKFVGGRRFLPFTDTDAYRNVKAATEAFVMANCGVVDRFHLDEAAYISDYVSINVANLNLSQLLKSQYLVGQSPDKVLPYLAVIRAKLADERIKTNDIGSVDLTNPTRSIDSCYGILKDRLQSPCLLELIWSYWQEEGMLIQTMNAITRRFQNMRSPGANDPLANLETDPLRSLNNLLWGVIQDEQHRLSVVRRNYEYDHHYGLRLAGKAVDGTRTADSRSKFLEAFHTLLSIVAAFYKRDDDTTMVADGFPVLNALKEAHLILSQGAHNQFGDLPSTARIEMLMQQWILARPEFREFIPTRIMVAYPEPWMDRVDAMKKLQNWTDTSVLHFRNLAIFGEQILLGIRYGNWNSVFEPVQPVNWARYWRPQIQGYMHAYRSVTGVDLTIDVTNARIDASMPSVHLVRRLSEQKRAS